MSVQTEPHKLYQLANEGGLEVVVDRIRELEAEVADLRGRLRNAEGHFRAQANEIADLRVRLRGAEGQVRDLQRKLAAHLQGADDA